MSGEPRGHAARPGQRGGRLSPLDVAIVALYLLIALAVGLVFARRAGRDTDEYFLSGRRLPWWLAGTSMVATTFAADTPLVVSGWVREHGIWKNWLWWCLAGGGVASVFLFARFWRRGGVMTTAELAELRYGGRAAGWLRGLLGLHHSVFTNTITICWVLVAAKKILAVLFGVDPWLAVGVASVLALSYSLMAGFWGVVVTDLLQFAMAMTGAVALAWFAWAEIGGREGLHAATAAGGAVPAERIAFFPPAGAASFFEAGFWTAPVAAVAVYLGVAWWANDAVDGGGPVVQRVAASRSPREGSLAVLWYDVAHFALRPWPWIIVALASLVLLPDVTLRAPQGGEVVAIRADAIEIAEVTRSADPGPARPREEGRFTVLDLASGADGDWRAEPRPGLAPGTRVEEGEIVARSDPEKAYVVMLKRYLPTGLLGRAIAALLAAFMSTIDTHVNLASSFFVNDVYRRFLRRGAAPEHYVGVARIVGAVVMAVAALFALASESISGLFTFFLSFLAGVGPVYVARWLWWRVTAWTEISAMLASGTAASILAIHDTGWSLGPLAPEGTLGYEGRVILVLAMSMTVALLVTLLGPRPEAARLVPFYERVRPPGAWGPVARLASAHAAPGDLRWSLIGTVGGLALVFGVLFAIGQTLFGHDSAAMIATAIAIAGGVVVAAALRRIYPGGAER
ncbi:MAG: sodium:solute symporter family protein [Planctomycetota bacterium]